MCCNQILAKAHKRRIDFKSTTGLNQPPTPVQSRWGTWLVAVKYPLVNFSKIKTFMMEFVPESRSAAHDDIKDLLSNTELEQELYSLRHLVGIADCITSIESRTLSAESQFGIIEKVRKLVVGTAYETKLLQSLVKNPDLESFTSEANAPDVRLRREFCSLVSVEVERPFSKYKAFYRCDRSSLKPENITHLMLVYYNSFL